MPQTFATLELQRQLADLFDHRFKEATNLLTMVWGTHLEQHAREYLEAVQKLALAMMQSDPTQERPTVAQTGGSGGFSGSDLQSAKTPRG